MKNKNLILGGIIILVITIIIILLILVNIHPKEGTTNIVGNTQISDQNQSDIYMKTNNTKKYFTVDERIKNYMLGLKNKNANVIMSYLNEDFITSYNISENNIFQILGAYNNYDSYITVEMYEFSMKNYTSYCVKGRIDGKFVLFEVGLDDENKTFDICPVTEELYESRISQQIKIETFENKQIQGKQYNFYNYKNLQNNEELIARLYYAEYLRIMLVDDQYAYSLLDTNYKNAKFSTIDKFREYIKNNNENLQIAYIIEKSDVSEFENYNKYYSFKQKNDRLSVKSYAAEKYDKYIQYVCVDGCDKYYIFNVSYPGEYTVILDKYTIDTQQFIDKYNNSKDANKVVMNVEKVKNAINNKDFAYVYEKLDNSFKQNYYPNLESFENYIKNKLFEYNKFDYSEARKESDVYELLFTVSNLVEDSQNKIDGTIIMQLKEGTDFVMSFSFD